MPGADFALLDALAVAGGTDCAPASDATACNATTGDEFALALETVRDAVGKCAAP